MSAMGHSRPHPPPTPTSSRQIAIRLLARFMTHSLSKALDLTVPPALLSRADDVIE
jgi:hypothetical protein